MTTVEYVDQNGFGTRLLEYAGDVWVALRRRDFRQLFSDDRGRWGCSSTCLEQCSFHDEALRCLARQEVLNGRRTDVCTEQCDPPEEKNSKHALHTLKNVS